jgi:hypothetical protein
MTHSVLYKINPVIFATDENILDIITSSTYLTEKAEAIAQLFIDRADPAIPTLQRVAHDQSCDERAAVLEKDISQFDFSFSYFIDLATESSVRKLARLSIECFVSSREL